MIFRQLFDEATSTYTYLLADEDTREAVIIDSVASQSDRDLAILSELGLKLSHVLDTHAHADHITGAGKLRAATGALSGMTRSSGASCVDLRLEHGDEIHFGAHTLQVRATPGHTAGCSSYVLLDDTAPMVFTGDALLIRGSGRTDFQEGNAHTLYKSVHDQLYTLADNTIVYPGHDYHGRTSSTIAEEKRENPRLSLAISEARFVEIMGALDLPEPKMIKTAVPANLACGELQ